MEGGVGEVSGCAGLGGHLVEGGVEGRQTRRSSRKM